MKLKNLLIMIDDPAAHGPLVKLVPRPSFTLAHPRFDIVGQNPHIGRMIRNSFPLPLAREARRFE